MKDRVQMSPDDLEALMRIMAANRMEYILSRGTKMAFWERIRKQLAGEIGKAPKKIQLTVKNIVDQRRARRRLGASGAVTDMDRYTDKWIERLDQLEDEKTEGQRLAGDGAAKVPKASAHAAGVKQSGKRKLALVDEEQDEGGQSEAGGKGKGDQYRIDGLGRRG
jgi:hypothetical protein